MQVKGIKGASGLTAHKHFNLSTGVVIDVMHCVFLGLLDKTLMNFGFGVSHSSSPFSIRKTVCKSNFMDDINMIYMYIYLTNSAEGL